MFRQRPAEEESLHLAAPLGSDSFKLFQGLHTLRR